MTKRGKIILKNHFNHPKRRPLAILLAVVIGILILGGLLLILYRDLPSPMRLSTRSNSYSTQIFDRNNKLLYTVYSSRNQTFVPLNKIPKSIQQATIAIEDRNFYEHGAIDLRGIGRALYSTLFHRELQGGSTLTQQLVKNSLLTPDRTIKRKLKEVFLSFATELMYPKNKILEMYLNQVPYGGTAYGVEAASETYFGKHVENLDIAESAFLTGLPEAPSTYSPFGSHPELGKERQLQVLQNMYDQGYISKKQLTSAKNEVFHFQKISNPIQAPHFVFYVKDLLTKKYGQQMVEEGGLKVYTSLDLNIQNFAQETVSTEVTKLEEYHVGNGAAIISNPATGEILAMVGSRDYFDPKNGNVNIALSHLQPGSSIKPINYAVGLLKGYTAATPFIDQQLCFPGGVEQQQYCPVNYDGKFHGVIQMREALANSINIPAVEMLKLNGIDAMLATASAMGITTFVDPNRYGLSLTLGGGEVTMLDMATAYGVFANGGYRVDLHPILKVVDRSGQILEQYAPPPSPIFGKKVIPPEVAFIISDILADNNARALEFGTTSPLYIPKQHVSVKTGTTNDFRDNWTIGYTPSYVVAIWVGNNDHTPMNGLVSGITGAAPIWHDLVAHLLQGKIAEIPQKPTGVMQKYVCSNSGTFAPPDNPSFCPTRLEYFIKGLEPKMGKVGQENVWIDKTTNDLSKPGQTDNIELKPETIVSDPLDNKYCLTCNHPTPNPSPTTLPH